LSPRTRDSVSLLSSKASRSLRFLSDSFDIRPRNRVHAARSQFLGALADDFTP
jgi:hypothetical protein